MSQKEYMELGKLKVKSSLEYLTVLNLRIDENVHDHGKMTLRLMVKEMLTLQGTQKLADTDISVTAENGDLLFKGIIQTVHSINRKDYCEVEIKAMSQSVKSDQEIISRTFQDLGKTLSSVANEVMKPYSIKVDVSKDCDIKFMLYQYRETDWEFLKRIASQFGFYVLTDSHSESPRIAVGEGNFSNIDKSKVMEEEFIQKDIVKYNRLKENDKEVSLDDFKKQTYLTNNLKVGVGHSLGAQVAAKNVIQVEGSLIVNYITLQNKKGVKPSLIESMEAAKKSHILTGTVLKVESTNLKVEFDVDVARGMKQDEAKAIFIPYEHEHNNYMYIMPDEKDIVFVYYENEGRVSCFGSKREKEVKHKDFNNPENKRLTSTNKMILFTPDTIELVGNRKSYDKKKGAQASVTFNENGDLDIYSTHDIRLSAKNDLILQAKGTSGTGKLECVVLKDLKVKVGASTLLINKNIVDIETPIFRYPKGSSVKYKSEPEPKHDFLNTKLDMLKFYSVLTGTVPSVVVGGKSSKIAQAAIGAAPGAIGKKSENDFVGKLKGNDVILKDVKIVAITYIKRTEEELSQLRNTFNSSSRKAFLKDLGKDTQKLKDAGISDADILKIQNGEVPSDWQVHHKLPLDDSGTNAPDNLVLILKHPYHKAVTNYQNTSTKDYKVGEANTLDWPYVEGDIYPKVKV